MKLTSLPRPHISEADIDAAWDELEMTVTDLIGATCLLFGLFISAVTIVLVSFWCFSAFYDLFLRHIIEG